RYPPLGGADGGEEAVVVERREGVAVGEAAGGDAVELRLHLGGEAEVEQGREVGYEEVADADAEGGGVELPRSQLHVAAALDGRERLAVRARPPDAVPLQRLDEGGLGVARRRLRLVRLGHEGGERDRQARAEGA